MKHQYTARLVRALTTQFILDIQKVFRKAGWTYSIRKEGCMCRWVWQKGEETTSRLTLLGWHGEPVKAPMRKGRDDSCRTGKVIHSLSFHKDEIRLIPPPRVLCLGHDPSLSTMNVGAYCKRLDAIREEIEKRVA